MPDFEVERLDGSTLRSEDLRGAPVLLNFYRYASCPVCASTLAPYQVRGAELTGKGVAVVSFFHSPAERMRNYFETQDLPFELVVDPQREVYTKFGVTPQPLGLLNPMGLTAMPASLGHMRGRNPLRSDGAMSIMPADFLVDADGVIVEAQYGRHLAAGWSIDEALALVAKHALAS
jgi:peroxiredoxin